jgi:type I restriction enzyme S subunit
MSVISLKKYNSSSDSNVEWIGHVPSHWVVTRNKDIFKERGMLSKCGTETLLTVSHITGVTKRSEKNVNMFMAESHVGYKIVRKGDLVINTMWAWMGALGTSNEEGICSPAYGVYMPIDDAKYDHNYFDYLYRTPHAVTEMTRHSKGIVSSRLRLYPKDFFQIPTALPPKNEQREIAARISKNIASIDLEIKLLNKKSNLFKELRQNLIDTAVSKGLNGDIPMQFSGIKAIGVIPKHWTMRRLKEIANIQNSNVDKKTHDHEINVKLCNYVDVYKNEFIDSSLDFMKGTANTNEIDKFQIKAGDLFITKDSETCDDIAVPAYATSTLKNVLCGYHLCQIRCDNSIILSEYLMRLFQSKGFGYRFVINAKGITRVGLGQSSIADALTPIPSIEEQSAIITYLRTKTGFIDKSVCLINEKIDKLKEFRVSMINEFVTGKLEIPIIEIKG